MSFNLSLKNIKKSFKDYAIYFITLVFGVAVFYIFNSMDSQQAMMKVTAATGDLIQLMLNMLGGISVFVSFVLGFLIIYANNFLIKRRKKEFGIYMTLGMSKGKISKILVFETFIVGLVSLGVGLLVGVFGSQLMSILVAKLFAADMHNYHFVFSGAALGKTVLFFGITYLCVMIFNTLVISKCKLINLITANRKSEKVKIKNPIICIVLFLISVGMLSYAYYQVVANYAILSQSKVLVMILIGTIATFLLFWSFSGFILKVIQSSKKLYLKNLNLFVLRQLNDKINTTTISISIICLMLFLTICILSSALSMNASMTEQLKTYTPVDVSMCKYFETAALYEKEEPGNQEAKTVAPKTVLETLKQAGYPVEQKFKDRLEVPMYRRTDLTFETTQGGNLENLKKKFPMLTTSNPETMMKVSDYNKIANLFGNKTLTLNDNEYVIVCNYGQMLELRNEALEKGVKITLNNKEYAPKQTTCEDGFVENAPQAMNMGIVVLPDNAFEEDWEYGTYVNANYNANSSEEIQKMENEFVDFCIAHEKELPFDVQTRFTIFDASRGLGAMVTFIGLYLGIIFLITSAAILALKELTESSDNKERYMVLRKIGADEKMINKALFVQIGIFFMLPMVMAIVHSIFGMQLAYQILKTIGQQNLLPSIITTAIFMIVIYGCYFVATYFGSRSIIKEDR